MKMLSIFARDEDAPSRSSATIFGRGVLDAAAARGVDNPGGGRGWEVLARGWSPTANALPMVGTHEAWRKNVWVRRGVDWRAQKIARLPLVAYRGDERLETFDLLEMLERPNKWLDGDSLWWLIGAMLSLEGEAFFLKDGEMLGRGAKALYPLHPSIMRERLNDDRSELLGWYIRTPRALRYVDRDQVWHIKLPSPYNQWRGASPLEPALMAASADLAMANYNGAIFANGAKPGGVLETDKDLDPTVTRRILDDFEERHKDPHRPAALTYGLKWRETQLKAQDVAYSEGRDRNRDEILVALGVPPTELGIGGPATYENVRTWRRVGWETTLLPLVQLYSAAMFDLHRDPAITIIHDVEQVEELRDSAKDKIELAERMFRMTVPWNKIDEHLEIGIGKTKGGDVGFVPVSLTPVEFATMPPSDPVGPDGESGRGDGESQGGPPTSDGDDPGDGSDDDDVTPEERSLRIATLFSAVKERAPQTGAPLVVARSEDEDQFVGWLVEALRDSELRFRLAISTPVKQALALGIEQAGELVGVDLDLTLEDPRIVEVLSTKLMAVSAIEETTLAALRQTLMEGVTKGESVERLAERVKAVFKVRRKRALMIARTEVSQAVNAARYVGFKEASVEYHQWFSAGDERVRETHRACDGVIVPLGMPFPNSLRFPGEVGGPRSEVINCRCITIPSEKAKSMNLDAYWARAVERDAGAIERRALAVVRAHFWWQRSRVLEALAKQKR